LAVGDPSAAIPNKHVAGFRPTYPRLSAAPTAALTTASTALSALATASATSHATTTHAAESTSATTASASAHATESTASAAAGTLKLLEELHPLLDITRGGSAETHAAESLALSTHVGPIVAGRGGGSPPHNGRQRFLHRLGITLLERNDHDFLIQISAALVDHFDQLFDLLE
jgi:hypothetical protein